MRRRPRLNERVGNRAAVSSACVYGWAGVPVDVVGGAGLDDPPEVHHGDAVADVADDGRRSDHPGAIYIRLGRGRDPEVYPEVPTITFGRADASARRPDDLSDHRDRRRGAARRCDAASDVWPKQGVDDAGRTTCTRSSRSMLERGTRGGGRAPARILTVEEHNRTNGLERPSPRRSSRAGSVECACTVWTCPTSMCRLAPPAALYAHYRLDADGITDELSRLLDSDHAQNQRE